MPRRRIPLRELVARGPVLSARERVRFLEGVGPSGVTYVAAPGTAHPVMPLQVFAAAYDLDLVLVDDHPDWDMHELARMVTPDGPVWLCKDSAVDTLDQQIAADLEDVDRWLPEVPLRRHRSPVTVDDRSTPAGLDLSLAYTNPAGERVEIRYRGPHPKGPLRKRNSSTMGHSARAVLAALDVSAQALARSAEVRIDGEVRPLRRIACLVPFAVALVQVQAGLSTGRWRQEEDGPGVRTVHDLHGLDVAQAWTVASSAEGVDLVQDHPVRQLRHRFARHGDHLELARVEVGNHGHDAPVGVLHLAPHLPDARVPFEGTFEGRWLLDVGGQPAHAVGRVTARWAEGALHLGLRPEAPRWTLDRPLDAVVRPSGDGVEVEVRRV
ncbi:MAG: hypothetical protein H6732_20150 [Alphaproteobacteria bacterium]|nr:hypothetical protein [Alphaproteobacteria bacterium]